MDKLETLVEVIISACKLQQNLPHLLQSASSIPFLQVTEFWINLLS